MNKIKGIMNLPQKVDLKKTVVNVEETEKAVGRIHESAEFEKEVSSLKTSEKIKPEPESTSAPRQKKKTSPPPPQALEKSTKKNKSDSVRDILEENTTRITIDLPESLYRGAKIKSFNEMMTLKSYIVGLLRDDLKI
jgi:hypothetical protein